MSQRLALLISHTQYQDDRLAVPHGSGDVAALAEALRGGRHGRFDNVHILLDKTAVDLQLAIAAFLEQPLTPDDLILLYFAGHCLFDSSDAFLAAADAFTEPYLDATTIQADFVRRRLNQCAARQLLILDCMHSRLDGAPEVDAPRRLGHAFGGPNRVVFLAAQPAISSQPSVFTQTLTQGLQGLAADSDRDGRLTVAEWFAYAQARSTAPDNIAPLWEKWGDSLHDGWVVTAVSPDKLIPPGALLPPTEEIPEVPPAGAALPAPATRRYGLIAALVVLLLLLGGWLVLRDGFASSPPATATTAVLVAAMPTNTPTATAVPASPTPETAVPEPTAESTSTATASPAPSRTPAPSATPTASATLSPSATATITPSPTATTTPIPMQITAEAAFLRAGPGVNYKIIAFPLQGTGVTAVARNSEATWYNVILADGQTGWIYTDVVRPDDTAVGPTLPIAATIPAPVNEFYNFSAQDTGRTLIVQIYHAYVGTRGEEALLRARLLPETNEVQPAYLNGDDLGLGLRIVEFTRTGSGSAPYTSTGVEFCMVDTAGESFYCQTFPVRKEW